MLGYTKFKEMIRLSAKAAPVPEEGRRQWIDTIFSEQPYLSNVYPGDTREIGMVFEIRDAAVEYFHLGVNPIFRGNYVMGNGKITPKATGSAKRASAAAPACRDVPSGASGKEPLM